MKRDKPVFMVSGKEFNHKSEANNHNPQKRIEPETLKMVQYLFNGFYHRKPYHI